MTTHIPHPVLGDRREFLVDGCPRCEEYVRDLGVPFDEDRFRAFWAKMVRVEFDDAEGYDSTLDRRLGRNLYHVALALQRAFGLDPRTLQPTPKFAAELLNEVLAGGASGAILRVLIVEDGVEMGEVVGRTLRESGADPLIVATVSEALEELRAAEFDVVLTDYDLPDGTGADVLADVARRAWPPGTSPTTILWSGLDRTRELAAVGVEADHVFTKEKLPEVIRLILAVRP
jgi:CheY-like chemotaxis protein